MTYFTSPYLCSVQTHEATLETLDGYLSKFLNAGFEGIILRNPEAAYEAKRSKNLLKLKPRLTAIYEITGVFEAVDIYGMPKNTLGGLYLTDGTVNFKCGAGCLSHAQRQQYWNAYLADESTLLDKSARIIFQEYSTSQIPLQPILKEII